MVRSGKDIGEEAAPVEAVVADEAPAEAAAEAPAEAVAEEPAAEAQPEA